MIYTKYVIRNYRDELFRATDGGTIYYVNDPHYAEPFTSASEADDEGQWAMEDEGDFEVYCIRLDEAGRETCHLMTWEGDDYPGRWVEGEDMTEELSTEEVALR